MNNSEKYRKAHNFCTCNETMLKSSQLCGCFYCLKIFEPSEIVDWIGDRDDPENRTARCPYCGIDSVVSDNCGYPVSEKFLGEMYEYWFS